MPAFFDQLDEAERRALIAKTVEELEADGFLRWNGKMRNGQKVYVTTEAGKHPNAHFDGPETKQ